MERGHIDTTKLEAVQGRTTNTEFARQLGISRAYLHKVKTHRAPAGGKFILGLVAAYPDTDIRDILTDDKKR